jgi:quercetin dioxygenase-like cupin family protein
MSSPRRVVTGHDEAGRSVVVSDGAVPVTRTAEDIGLVFHEVWNTTAAPAPVTAVESEPTARPVRIAPDGAGTVIRVNEFLPGHVVDGLQSPMHRTASVDYGIVLEGAITLILTDSEVDLVAGDIVVQRGTDHAWANRSDEVARMAFILVGGEFSSELRDVLGDGARESGLDHLTQEVN